MKNISETDWKSVYHSLNTRGYAIVKNVLGKEECDSLKSLYDDSTLYRSVINMQQYRFGKGEYKYFNYPLPPIIQRLREELYQPLTFIANEWMQQLSIETSFPLHHHGLIDRCKAHDQLRPTPLILKYGQGGYNTLHQDLYGDIYFPFQAVIVLSQHSADFEGGEFVMTEQVPRAQSKAEVIRPDKGGVVIITTNFRPVRGSRGYYRAAMRHGISEVKSGERYAMGIIFHDAK